MVPDIRRLRAEMSFAVEPKNEGPRNVTACFKVVEIWDGTKGIVDDGR